MQYINVRAKFVEKKTGKPISGSGYLAKLFDRDIFKKDDFMGEGTLNGDGEVEITCDLANAGLEITPDLYFVLFHNEKNIFKSKVKWNVNFLTVNKVTGVKYSTPQDLGTFEI